MINHSDIEALDATIALLKRRQALGALFSWNYSLVIQSYRP